MFDAMIGASFDPLTNGHLWMIEQAVKRFKLHIAIAVNPDKKYTFTDTERRDMLVESIAKLGSVGKDIQIDVIPHLYLAKFAHKKGVRLLLRGIRNEDDFKYERAIRHANAKLCPEIDTLFMMPPRDLEEVSSSFVKNWIGPEGWEKEIADYVPAAVYYALLRKFEGKYFCYGIGGGMGKGCDAKLTPNERRRVMRQNGGYCDKCVRQHGQFMESR